MNMINTSPQVSILMPAYNAEKYIAAAIDSVLNQSFSDFELIIVNDGSIDLTENIIRSYSDPRIKLLSNEKNSGLLFSRNRLISEARGEFFAWLDADDVYHNNIIQSEYDYLQNNKTVDVVTSWARVIDGRGSFAGGYFKSYATISQLPLVFLFVNYIVQSSVMARKKIFEEFLFEDYPVVLDFDMWSRILDKYKIHIIQKVLVDYRIHNNNMSIVDSDKGREAILKLYARKFSGLNIHYSENDLLNHYDIAFGVKTNAVQQLFVLEKWLNQLRLSDQLNSIYERRDINKVFSHRWLKVCYRDKTIGLKAIQVCVNSDLFTVSKQSVALTIQYLLKIFFSKKTE
jgi:glycosyltransferase involved in cell wall biosynthesis